jgi:thioredoxin-dependent peroxiredoxin
MNTMILGATDQAPDFTGIAVGAEFGDGMPIRLGDYFDSQIVLYFYPQDHTPGCTAQACKLRDAWEEFGSRAALFGVSTDSSEAHRQFIELHSLPFPLISDSDQRIVRAYGVWLDCPEGGTGAKYQTERTTFVIAPGGRIKTVLRKVNPYLHDRILLEALYS